MVAGDYFLRNSSYNKAFIENVTVVPGIIEVQ
jgi:hypothetical protein